MAKITEEDLKLIKQIWLKARSRIISLKKLRTEYFREKASYEQFITDANEVISNLAGIEKASTERYMYDLNDLRLQIMKIAQDKQQNSQIRDTLFKLLTQNDS